MELWTRSYRIIFLGQLLHRAPSPQPQTEAKLGKRKASALHLKESWGLFGAFKAGFCFEKAEASPNGLSCYRSASNSISYLKLNIAAAAPRSGEGEGEGDGEGGGDAGGRRLLRRAQQADIAPHHRRGRGRLRPRAAPRRRARRSSILARPRAAGRVDVGATGLHAVPPRRQLRQQQQQQRQWRRRCQDVAAAVRQQGHRGVHPPVLARLGAPQEEGQEQGWLQRGHAQGASTGREHPCSSCTH